MNKTQTQLMRDLIKYGMQSFLKGSKEDKAYQGLKQALGPSCFIEESGPLVLHIKLNVK
jgi:hypothetical protein